MKKYILLMISIVLTLHNKAQTVSDANGNIYNTVTIGTQIWMKENLKVTKYNNNALIPNVTSISTWSTLTTPAYCSYNNTSNVDTISTYGRLYNWYTVNTAKLCPVGWHVPTNTEWTTLEIFFISNGFNYDGTIIGKKYAKALASVSGWVSTTTAGAVGNTDYPDKRNASGFTALPSGYRFNVGSPINIEAFMNIGKTGCWWSSTGLNTTTAYFRTIYNSNYDVYRDDTDGNHKCSGYSVRCLKDGGITPVNNLSNPKVKFIYPNPATDMLYIKNIQSSDAVVLIFNLQGKQIVTRQIGLNSIDISNLSKGIYMVKIIDSDNILMDKLVKE